MEMKVKKKYLFHLFLSLLLLCTAMPVQATGTKAGSKRKMEELIQFQPLVDSCYNFTVENAMNICISNREKTKSDVVYMEYEVGKVTGDQTNQSIVAAATGPSVMIMGGIGKRNGYVTNYKTGDGSPMLVSGAKYYICFAKRQGELEVYVQRTMNGTTEVVKFPYEFGEWNDAFEYFTLFFGEERARKVSCEFKNFKCYDESGKDLGIQLDSENILVEITQMGLLGDHTLCEAAYYCEEKPELGIIVLGEKCKGYRDVNGAKEEFNYGVYAKGEEPATINLRFKDGKEVFDYQYVVMTDDDGNKYQRLQNAQVTFVVDGESKTQTLTASHGFRIAEPEAPSKEGTKFLGWYLGNDEKYDFNSIVSESITLYAKWEDGPEFEEVEEVKETTSENVKGNANSGSDSVSMVVSIAVSVITIIGCVICSILILRRKKHAKE